jgi:outer membrane lipoprotein-sorting protein
MRRLGFVFVLMLAIASLLVVGCGDDEEGEEPTPTPTATPEVTPTPTATPPPGELSDILGWTSAIESLKFDMAITGPGYPDAIASKVWQKTNKMKTETTMQGMTIVTYIDYDAQRLCAYIPVTGMVMATDFSMAQADPLDQAETILDYQPTIIGSETIDGKDCLVFEWTAEGVTTKWWLAKDDGFPRRVETTTAQGTTTIEYSNVEFTDIPDSEFEFPPECG